MSSEPFFQGQPPSLIAAMGSAIVALLTAVITLWRRLVAKDRQIEEKDQLIHSIQEARIQEHKEAAHEITTARRILDRTIDIVSSVRPPRGPRP